MLRFVYHNKNINLGGEVSQLQYQLRELLPRLSSQAKSISDPEAKKRYYLIRAVAFSVKDVKKACEARGESPRTFYKWSGRLLETESIESLRSGSRAPKTSPNKIESKIENEICRIRKKYPYKGPEQIFIDLLDEGEFKTPPHPSTIYQVLLRNKLIKEEYKKALTKKHMKRYTRPYPGYLQMDFKYVPYAINGVQYYQLSCIDHHSSWRLIRAYTNKDLEAVSDFLEELKSVCPFRIIEMQTDNDAAFTDKYRIGTDGFPTGHHVVDLWCTKLGIYHRLIPIGVKELNGKVENSHKWDDREHFSQINPKSIDELKILTRRYNRRWNEKRRTKKLHWKSPNQVLYGVLFFFQFTAIMIKESLPQNIEIEKPKEIEPKPEKTKKPDYFDRYMKYVEWDGQRQSIVSPISPNYSGSKAFLESADRVESCAYCWSPQSLSHS